MDKTPPPQKEKTSATLSELLSRDYKARMRTLTEVQNKLNKMFFDHPVYEEYQRRDKIEKLYKELEKQHKKSLREVNNLYKTANKTYRKWLKVIASLHRKEKIKAKLAKIIIKISSTLGYICGKILKLIDSIKR